MQRMAQQATAAGQHQQQAALLLNNINLVAKLIERVQENSVQMSGQVHQQQQTQQQQQQQQHTSLLGNLNFHQDHQHQFAHEQDIDGRDFDEQHLCDEQADDEQSDDNERLDQEDDDDDSQLEVDDHEKPFFLATSGQDQPGQQEIVVSAVQESPFRLKAGTSTAAVNAASTNINNTKKSNKKKMAKQRRLYKCRHCGFETDKKVENWQHIRIHMRPEKLLACDACQFVTEYKHHLEYHQRNHSGYKPFKCEHCDYQCVNKSMLNSHMKSHSSVYQYQCGDCKYATKYVHSLKMHLRKYNHQPTQLMIDVYGRKRGPKSTSSSSSGSTSAPNNGSSQQPQHDQLVGQQDQQCSILDLRVDSKLVGRAPSGT